MVNKQQVIDTPCEKTKDLSVLHEQHEIGYQECANALLKMWMDDILTDGEYSKIADRLNKRWLKQGVDK